MKGEFVVGNTYDKLWQVTYLGSTYQSKIDNNATIPAELVGGKVVHRNTDNWLCIADVTDALNSCTDATSSITTEVEASKTQTAACKTQTEASEAQTALCKTQTSECKTQTDLAEEQNQHPTYVGDDNYVYKWDTTTKAYVKTSLYVKGDNGNSPKIVNENWWVYNDADGKYEDTGINVKSDYQLTKAKVEAVLTGDITSHTHSQYAEQTSLDSAITRIASLEDGSATDIEVAGTGNAITNIAKDGTKITATKGTTFLTEHQDISGKADVADLNAAATRITTLEGNAATAVSVTGTGDVVTAISKDGNTVTATKGAIIPTKTSQLTNDSDFVTSEEAATKEWIEQQGYIKEDDLKETLVISLASNQSSDTSIIGAAITVKSGDSTLNTYTWDGNTITLKLSAGQAITVSCGSVANYKTPDAQSFTTVEGNSRNITMTYQTEVVTVTVSASDGTSVSGQRITVNGTAYTYSSAFSVKVPFGTSYSVSADAKELYSTPATQTFTANQASRSVTMVYTYTPTGIYILDTDGALTTAANWNTANNSKAVGVAVLTDNCRFVIAPEMSSSTLSWGGYGTTISDIVTTSNSSIALKDYAGGSNTDQIIAQLGASNAPAANYCKTYTFKNGKSGYLWSLGEMKAAYDNKSAIDTALSKIGATAMDAGWHWTSTQYSSNASWLLGWCSGNVDSGDKRGDHYVRAVCAF